MVSIGQYDTFAFDIAAALYLCVKTHFKDGRWFGL